MRLKDLDAEKYDNISKTKRINFINLIIYQLKNKLIDMFIMKKYNNSNANVLNDNSDRCHILVSKHTSSNSQISHPSEGNNIHSVI